MKKRMNIKLYLPFLVILMVLATFNGCSKEDPLTITEEKFLLLEGTWGLGSIVVDGVDQSANYPGFTMSFTQTGYSVTSGGTLLRSGDWEWTNDQGTTISLTDGKDLDLVSLTETSLVFTFIKVDGGVAAGISGNYRMSLEKQ